LDHHITPTVYHERFAETLSRLANGPVPIHVKIDTGMSRLGFPWKGSLDRLMHVASLKHLQVEGIFSHFATSDEQDKDFALLQLDRFDEVLQGLKKRGLDGMIRHMANSGAILDLPQSHMDLVRPGILIYGMYPSEQVDHSQVKVRPVKRFVTHVSHVKTIEAGETVSYGRTYTASKITKVATLPVGYADGYSRLLSNKAQVLIHNKRSPVIGTVCMDQTMVDVSHLGTITVGEEVTLYGDDPTIEEVAGHMGTISYEVTCMASNRVPKVYLQDGACVCIVRGLTD
jgi:alanine racemase